ncbi:EAL domain-containing protein [Sulfurovum sp. TSL1]|uniref:bifunctional diguanylate cyclase/phosphodiesterase n=1 Tax=Sulfurovum sp. TSL1 TaxID=2826994 RepID=UPI001CC5BB94|nr:EAL domain-containing protein [Sulfurovum sp. TSL1]GIT98349.1 hypothetical protein TSL1_11700 [Sulfurovum sp. TSL1]
MPSFSPQSNYPNNSVQKGWIVGIFIFFIFAIVLGTLIWHFEKIRIQQMKDRIENIANENISNLHKNIDQILALSYPLSTMVQEDGNIDNFKFSAEELLEYFPLISEIALAPHGIIEHIVPLSGNEKALGLNLLNDPKQKEEALLAHKTGKIILAGPLQLVQGREALVSRFPIYRGTENRFWGFIFIAIRFPDIIDVTFMDKLKEEGYQYVLSRININTGKEQIIAASGTDKLKQPVEQTIDIPNGQWTLRIAPINGWHNQWLLTIEIVLGILLSILLGYIAKQYTELRNYRNSLETLVQKRTSEILATKSQLRMLLNTIPDLIWLKDSDGVFLFCNPTFERFFGAKEEEIVGRTDYDFVNKELADFFREKDRLVMTTNKTSMNEEYLEFADGSYEGLFETLKSPMFDETGKLIGVLGIARDITRRHNNELHINHLTQLYTALSECNHAIVHAITPNELFSKICKSAVVQGGMDMAWIGLIDPKSKYIYSVASYGDEKNYLEGIEISTREDVFSGKGPTGTAVRENRPYWCQDFMGDPATAPWHDRGSEMGWKSSAALPISLYDNVIGVFTIYSKTLNAFDSLSQQLLIEMSSDISFAMENFDRETKRKAAEDNLIQTERLLEEMSSMAHVGGWEFDLKSGMGHWTKEIALIHDLDPNIAVTVDIGLSVYKGEWLQKIQTALDDAIHKGISYDLILKMETAKGNEKWVHTIGSPVIQDGEVIMVRGSMQDITTQRTAEEKVQWLANFDSLTGLPNRILLKDRVQYAINIAYRTKKPIALLFVNLDHFKNINDSLGHDIGDTLLLQVSKRIQSVLREEDTLSRHGGDEFIIVLPDIDADGAAHVAEKLIHIISQSYTIEKFEVSITPSIGIGLYPTDGSTVESLIKSSDAAMQRAKHDGRNCYRFFTLQMQANSSRKIELENALKQALQHNEFEIYYQPQISMDTGDLIGAEALLRWKHPVLGVISPTEFIPIAEQSGQIVMIGEWVLRNALGQLKRWITEGIPPFMMAINLSAIQFRHPQLVSMIVGILEELQLPAEYLLLELTESITMEDPSYAIDLINELYDHGIRMSIDDFGTGYSSLIYLKQFRVYKLKIDQSFIHDIIENSEDRTLVNTIINMAHNLNLTTIAEGVETAEQLAILRKIGCDEIQGYYFSKALSSMEFEQFVRRDV